MKDVIPAGIIVFEYKGKVYNRVKALEPVSCDGCVGDGEANYGLCVKLSGNCSVNDTIWIRAHAHS